MANIQGMSATAAAASGATAGQAIDASTGTFLHLKSTGTGVNQGIDDKGWLSVAGTSLFKSSIVAQGAVTVTAGNTITAQATGVAAVDVVGGITLGGSAIAVTATNGSMHIGKLSGVALSIQPQTGGANYGHIGSIGQTTFGLGYGADQTTLSEFPITWDTSGNSMFGQDAAKSTFSVTGALTLGPASPVVASTWTGTYVGGSAHVCVTDAGVLFVSEAACP